MAADLANALPAPIELKGGLFTLTVLYLRTADYEVIDQHLAQRAEQAPGFFRNNPVVIDLGDFMSNATPLDFGRLRELLWRRGLMPVGVRNGPLAMLNDARLTGLATLPDVRPPSPRATESLPPPPAPPPSPSRLVTAPIRSGQQVYSPGDLIVTNTVGNGAEVVADGNIHIYGVLRGRALAGAKNDNTARIFCQSLEAELISIAGVYRLFEDNLKNPSKGNEFWQKPVQISLTGDRLQIDLLQR